MQKFCLLISFSNSPRPPGLEISSIKQGNLYNCHMSMTSTAQVHKLNKDN